MKILAGVALTAVLATMALPADARSHRHHHARAQHSQAAGFDGELAALPGPLQALVSYLRGNCGSRVVAVNQGHSRNVAGTRRVSLHKLNRAVDVAGNPSCILGHLGGWPGGASTDYGAVGHTHLSYEPGGREWGARFVHHGHAQHYAARKHHGGKHATNHKGRSLRGARRRA